ncbi:TPA: type II toxin-antitoxin system RelE/ParE family toxin [Vibrio parahaemolyticus]|uniref:Type II toxin-antitoxin system RelE/ParE family toxin n=1 Tax=Vibrio sinensis TaxID=2302434 RepID=A0A3A6QHW4_9VIBR|nr:type II toxin-antitoxin system RelE/ParE family toxin [Vibrio sinensis]
MNTILWSKRAVKQARKVQTQDRLAIVENVETLKDFPNCRNVKRLTNHEYDYRLRVGRYRVLFDFDGSVRIVEIQEIKKRDTQTY